MTIEAEHYGETRKALMADPIIRDMAEGVRDTLLKDIAWTNLAGQLEPKHEFMMAALREYGRRGGEIGTHIGGPAEAILALLNETKDGDA